MATWKSVTDSNIHNFWDVVEPCGRGKSLHVLQYLEQKGILPSRASSSSFSSESDTEVRIFQPVRSPGTCAGRGMVLTEQDRCRRMTSFQVGHERWDDAVHSQLRRANKQGYTTDAFEYQLKMLHKAQEKKEREMREQFEDSTGDDASSISDSASCSESPSLAPSPSPHVSLCSLPVKSSGTNLEGKATSETDLEGKTKSETDLEGKTKSETDLEGKTKSEINLQGKIESESDIEDKVKNVTITEEMTQQPKPAYKSVRARNVLLNSLAKMSSLNARQEQVTGDQLPQNAPQEQVTSDQLPQNAPQEQVTDDQLPQNALQELLIGDQLPQNALQELLIGDQLPQNAPQEQVTGDELFWNVSQEQVSGDQLGTECMGETHLSFFASNESTSESPLIFHSAASSPKSDAGVQNLIYDSGDDEYREEEKVVRPIDEEISTNESCINDEFTYNLNPFNNDEINNLNSFSQPNSKRIPHYPSFVGQYYNNHHSDLVTINLNDTGYMFGRKSKSPKFSPPSLVGLGSLNFTHKTNNYNPNFKFKPEDFPPLK